MLANSQERVGDSPRCEHHYLNRKLLRNMKIEKIEVTTFKSTSKKVNDTDGHTHPGPEHDTTEALLTITDDEGNSGYSFGSPEALRPYIVENFFKKVFMGEDPRDREKLWINLAKWQRGSGANLTDRSMAVAEMALWDLAGRASNTPVWKMLGGYRDKVLAYGSTMCGDEMQASYLDASSNLGS
jgi:L-alanine-DL-glutamate epimerase-like enolase superfamily enzyme